MAAPEATLEMISKDIAELAIAPHLATCKVGSVVKIRFDINSIGVIPIQESWVRVWHRTDDGWKYKGVQQYSYPQPQSETNSQPEPLSNPPRCPSTLLDRDDTPLHYSKYEGTHLRDALQKLTTYMQYQGIAAPPSPQQIGLIIQYFKLWIRAPYWDRKAGYYTRPDLKKAELTFLRGSADSLQGVDDCERWLCDAIDAGYNPFISIDS